MKLLICLCLQGTANALSQRAADLVANGGLNGIPVVTIETQNPTGPFWTAWSDTYGCSNNLIPFRQFCGFPRRYKLQSVRYKECVMRDGSNYPDKVFRSDFVHSRYRSFLNNAGVLANDNDAYDNLNFGDVKPLKGDPKDRLEQNYRLIKDFANFAIENGNTNSRAETCEYVNGVRTNCIANSINKLCDPRFQAYADNFGITVEDVRELHDANNADVTAAIREPFLVFKEEYNHCIDGCPIPLPFTSWNCNCKYGSQYSAPGELVASANTGSCDCGDEAPKRFSMCYDQQLDDDVTCSSIASDMAADYPGQCTVNDAVGDAAYVTTAPVIDNRFAPLLHESWYGRTPNSVYNQFTNWYQLSTGWITADILDLPWRKYKIVDLTRVDKAFKGEANTLRTRISQLTLNGKVLGANQVEISIAQLENVLLLENVIERRVAFNTINTTPAISPISDYSTDFFNKVRRMSNPEDLIYAHDEPFDLRITDNPCHLASDGNRGREKTINSFKLEEPRYRINADKTQLVFTYNLNNGEVANDKAAHEVLRFVLYHFNPTEIGYQSNVCNEVTAVAGEWSQWSACDAACGGVRSRTRQCQTSNNRVLTWARTGEQTGRWELVGPDPLDISCLCDNIVGEEFDQCGEVCRYDQWAAWSICKIGDLQKNCRVEGEDAMGTQSRVRGLTCGDEDRCCGTLDVRECYIPICPGWSAWAAWSCCSVTCGDSVGHRVRTRACEGAEIGSTACPCGGQLANEHATCDTLSQRCENVFPLPENDPGYFETETCNPDALCPVLIEEWSDWSACSETCGDGVRQRSYTCQNAPGQLGLIPECMGNGKVHEEETCSNDPCPNNPAKRSVFTDDTEWSEWSKCPCGDEVFLSHNKERFRISGGVFLTETAECQSKPCAALSEWTKWSKCTEKCHGRGGTERRFKNCINGNWGNGNACGNVMPLETRECTDLPPCPTWSKWSNWEDGNDSQFRIRQCVNPGKMNPIGLECRPGDHIEQVGLGEKLKFKSNL